MIVKKLTSTLIRTLSEIKIVKSKDKILENVLRSNRTNALKKTCKYVVTIQMSTQMNIPEIL